MLLEFWTAASHMPLSQWNPLPSLVLLQNCTRYSVWVLPQYTVKCTGQEALLKGYCMTYAEGVWTFLCRYRYFEIKAHKRSEILLRFNTLPGNIMLELNDYMCGPMNRTGISCSECIENFGPLVVPYRPICSNCIENSWYLGVLFNVLLCIVPSSTLSF